MLFPGMDPYLENPQLFPGIHSRMIVYMADQLSPLLRPRYLTSTGERVYVEGPEPRPILPDVWIRGIPRNGRGTSVSAAGVLDEPTVVVVPEMEVREPYIEILDRESGMRVVAIIELLSPSNKYAGAGREAYQAKQRETLSSETHLIEIDLLRYGPHALAVPEARARGRFAYDYLICVNRSGQTRNRYETYARTVRDCLPTIGMPLAGEDPDVPLDIQAAFEQAYEAGGYRERIDYRSPCEPPLAPEDQVWADELVQNGRSGVSNEE